jgi:hypothetical protein
MSKHKEAKTAMTMDEMLEHIQQYHGKVFKNCKKGEKNEHITTYNKIWRLLERTYGFVLVRLNKSGVTFRHNIDKLNYIDVSFSYIETPGYEKGTATFEGILHVKRKTKAINPHTGNPWQLGDVDYNNPLKPILTENGWWTGD